MVLILPTKLNAWVEPTSSYWFDDFDVFQCFPDIVVGHEPDDEPRHWTRDLIASSRTSRRLPVGHTDIQRSTMTSTVDARPPETYVTVDNDVSRDVDFVGEIAFDDDFVFGFLFSFRRLPRPTEEPEVDDSRSMTSAFKWSIADWLIKWITLGFDSNRSNDCPMGHFISETHIFVYDTNWYKQQDCIVKVVDIDSVLKICIHASSPKLEDGWALTKANIGRSDDNLVSYNNWVAEE